MNTIVFDIDQTICYRNFNPATFMYPECMVVDVEYTNATDSYFFIPHFEVMLKYLLNQGCRIAFFSLGNEYRNSQLIRKLKQHPRVRNMLTQEQLIDSNQFTVLSVHHVNKHGCKGLALLLEPGQTIDDIILVDDCRVNACVMSGEKVHMPYYYWTLEHGTRWPLNYGYCLLALFMRYFETVKASGVSLRQYVGNIVFQKDRLSRSHPVSGGRAVIPKDFSLLIVEGLNEVRKTIPVAVHYNEWKDEVKDCIFKSSTRAVRHEDSDDSTESKRHRID